MAQYIILYDSASTFDLNESNIHLSKITTRAESYKYEDSDSYAAEKVTIEDVATGIHSGKTCLEVDWNEWYKAKYGWNAGLNVDIVNPDTLVGLASVYDSGTGSKTYGVSLDIHIDWSRPVNLELYQSGPGWSSEIYGTGYPISGDTNGNDYVFIYNRPENDSNYMYNAILCYVPFGTPNPNADETVLGTSNETILVNTHNENIMAYEKYESADIPTMVSITPGIAYIEETKQVSYNMLPVTVETVRYDEVGNTREIISTKTVKSLDIPFSALVEDALNYLSSMSASHSCSLFITCGLREGVNYENYDSGKTEAFSFFYDFTENKLRGEITYGKKILIECIVTGRPK